MKNGTAAMIQKEFLPYIQQEGISLFIWRGSVPDITAKILNTYRNVYCKAIGDPKEKHIFSVCSNRTHESFFDIIVR